MLMALFASSEVARFKLGTLEEKLYENYLLTHQKCYKEQCDALFENFEGNKIATSPDEEKEEESSTQQEKKVSQNDPNARSLNFKETRPPNNARLNFYHLLHEPEQPYYPKGFSIYETTAQLLRNLYGNSLLLQKKKDIEYALLDALLSQKEKTKHFVYPDELASIELGDASLQMLFHQMLQGGYLQTSYPSLLDYITFDAGGTPFMRKINFLFVSEPLLHSLIKEPTVVGILLEQRAMLWEEIRTQEKNRHKILQKDAMGRLVIQKRTQEIVESVLSLHGIDPIHYKTLFDYSLGKKGNIIYVEDLFTHSYKREKIISLGTKKRS
jgi:hypothetical protein